MAGKEYSYAKVEVKGRLGRDLELRYTASGKAFANGSVAVSKMVKGEKATDWYRLILWGDLAETEAQKGYSKGDTVIAKGRLQQSEWKKKDGSVEQSVEVVVTEIEKEG